MSHFKSDSSTIQNVGYNSETKVLTVTFKNGGTYHYSDVTADQFHEFKNAESHGKHFHKVINGSFAFTKNSKGKK